MHWLLNVVTGPEGFPAAVLIRAIQPTAGLDFIAQHRPGVPPKQYCDGPAKICRALAIDGALNGIDLCSQENGLFITAGQPVPDQMIETSPRIGISEVPEPWRSLPWRFVSRPGGEVV
jgi:DNA-3-methyladenine glycosylase